MPRRISGCWPKFAAVTDSNLPTAPGSWHRAGVTGGKHAACIVHSTDRAVRRAAEILPTPNELYPVSHGFICQCPNEPKHAPNLFARRVALLLCENDAAMVTSCHGPVGVNFVKVPDI